MRISSISPLKTYMDKRLYEVLEKYEGTEFEPVIEAGFHAISYRMSLEHTQFTPDLVRKLELLEVLLMSFIQHLETPRLIEETSRKLRQEQ